MESEVKPSQNTNPALRLPTRHRRNGFFHASVIAEQDEIAGGVCFSSTCYPRSPECVQLIYTIFTARAARTAMISNESKDCSIMKTFAHRARTGESVGEKAVLVLNARKR